VPSAGDDLPEVSTGEARRLVLSVGIFWAGCGIASLFLDHPIGVLAFPAGFTFYATLYRIWGTRMFVWPRRGMFRETGKQFEAMLSLFRPSFIRRVFLATGWPPVLVGLVLASLLLGAGASMFVVASENAACGSRAC
jgi:hypothetical protein